MLKRNLALVNYHDPVFWPFAQRLEADGFQVYWINTDPVVSQGMRTLGVPDERICDVLEGDYHTMLPEECVNILDEYEQPGLPTINNIIFMDQDLRHAQYSDALLYLAQAAIKIRSFLIDRDIQLVSSGRDTALQMMTMLVCKKLSIFWGCVTRVKLPKEWFGFSLTQQGDIFYEMRPVEDRDYEFAKTWLNKFRSDSSSDISTKPLAKPKIEGFSGMIIKHVRRLIPVLSSHLGYRIKTGSHRKIPSQNLFWYLARYIKVLRNYCYYRFFLKFYRPVAEPFILYGLHRQPESSIDVRGAFFDDQLTLIKQIVRSIPVTHKLYVKVHFSDVAGQSPKFYRTLMSYPAVKLVDPDVDSKGLIRRASVIVTNVGAMGQEGGYLGRPVIAMSKMFWCNLPTVRYCGTPAELPGLIRSMIESPPVDDFDNVVKAVAGYIANNVPCDPNQAFLGKAFSENDLNVLSEVYRHIYEIRP